MLGRFTCKGMAFGAAVGLAALVGGCAGQQPPPVAAAAVAPVPPGSARIWFYRDYEPYETLATPYVRVNDGIAGISRPGATFYRDVPPGHYRLSVDSWGMDINQFPTVDVASGQTIYAKVESLKSWADNGGDNGSFNPNTFYVRLQPPAVAAAAVAHSPFSGGT